MALLAEPDARIGQVRARGCEVAQTSRSRSTVTSVYTCVVVTEAWPSSSCTTRTSAPPSSRWVAKECRSVCGETADGFIPPTPPAPPHPPPPPGGAGAGAGRPAPPGPGAGPAPDVEEQRATPHPATAV